MPQLTWGRRLEDPMWALAGVPKSLSLTSYRAGTLLRCQFKASWLPVMLWIRSVAEPLQLVPCVS